ncbi:hypothetical protein GTCCBUS3UF5_34490 [Geobacillus thermoleovorans CCB_US3_UF5]|uniref:Uncharacterized protein n=1 Tax=Geobacillus thermoleovorans CCB_US3_UF5 TaxID=1111068 RepID=A0ABM5MMB4_GEOTH|nr:hypothetical protein GTCCBUS3UF5_34490 [Geobacillus thermoleovorans CCB_US3_UF5]
MVIDAVENGSDWRDRADAKNGRERLPMAVESMRCTQGPAPHLT